MLHRHLILPGTLRIHSLLRKEVHHDGFLCYNFFCIQFIQLETYIELHIFCLLTSIEPILIPNISLLHLYSSNMNVLETSYRHKYNDYNRGEGGGGGICY